MAKFYIGSAPAPPSIAAAAPQARNIPRMPELQRGGRPVQFGTIQAEVQPRDITSAATLRQAYMPENLARSLISGPIEPIANALGNVAQDLGLITQQIAKVKDAGDYADATNLYKMEWERHQQYVADNNLTAAQSDQRWLDRSIQLRKDIAELSKGMSPPTQRQVLQEFEYWNIRKNTELSQDRRTEQIQNTKTSLTTLMDNAIQIGDIEGALKANDKMLAAGIINPAQHTLQKQRAYEGVDEYKAILQLGQNPRIVLQEMDEKLSGKNEQDIYPYIKDLPKIHQLRQEAASAIDRRQRDAVISVQNQMAEGRITKPEQIDAAAGGNIDAVHIKDLKNDLANPDPVYDQARVARVQDQVRQYKREPDGSGDPEFYRLSRLIATEVPKRMQGGLNSELYNLSQKKDPEKLPGTDPINTYIAMPLEDMEKGAFWPLDPKTGKRIDPTSDEVKKNPQKYDWARKEATSHAMMIREGLRQWAADNPEKAKDPAEIENKRKELYNLDTSQLGKEVSARPTVSETRLRSQPETTSELAAPLISQREAIMSELDSNPATKMLAMQMLDTEGGGAATMEALINRVAMIRQKIPDWTIWDELNSGFYGPIKRGYAQTRELAAGEIQQYEADIAAVRAGSNIIRGRTDQGYPGDPNWAGPGRVQVASNPKEVYNYWRGKRRGVVFSHAEAAQFAMPYG